MKRGPAGTVECASADAGFADPHGRCPSCGEYAVGMTMYRGPACWTWIGGCGGEWATIDDLRANRRSKFSGALRGAEVSPRLLGPL